MSLIVRFVYVSHCDIKVVEHFTEFSIVEDTTGKWLSYLLLVAIEKLGLNIDCRGQGYDNGASMKGKHEGVQAHILRANSREFFTTCDWHILNPFAYTAVRETTELARSVNTQPAVRRSEPSMSWF
jgi:hypothetical protein